MNILAGHSHILMTTVNRLAESSLVVKLYIPHRPQWKLLDAILSGRTR